MILATRIYPSKVAWLTLESQSWLKIPKSESSLYIARYLELKIHSCRGLIFTYLDSTLEEFSNWSHWQLNGNDKSGDEGFLKKQEALQNSLVSSSSETIIEDFVLTPWPQYSWILWGQVCLAISNVSDLMHHHKIRILTMRSFLPFNSFD